MTTIQADEVKIMNGVTSAQFISAGICFYPRCGYKRLSEQAIAEHLNSNLETFNRMFADKDEFVKAMLIEYVTLQACPEFCALEGTRTFSLNFKDVFIRAEIGRASCRERV